MIGTLNPFARSNQKPIVYNVISTGMGWQVQALVPERVSEDDKTKVIDWFRSYRSTLQRQFPLWLTVFRTSGHNYYLDIVTSDSPKQLISHAVDTGLAWQQMELDLGYAERQR